MFAFVKQYRTSISPHNLDVSVSILYAQIHQLPERLVYFTYFHTQSDWRTSMNTLLFFLLFLGFCTTNTYAQISKKHYIPPVFGVGAGTNPGFILVLTTLEETPFDVTITNGDGTYSETVSLSKDLPQELNPKLNNKLVGYVIANNSNDTTQPNLNGLLNTTFSDKGFILEGSSPFFANYHINQGAQADILTSKGTSGIGTDFFTGHQHGSYSEDNSRAQFTSVMAIHDGTSITFTNSRVQFWGKTSNTFSITLNAGESYIVGNSMLGIVSMCGATNTCVNDYNGTHIVATKEIVVNSGSSHGGFTTKVTGVTKDVGFDQIVPIEYVGTEYILIEGNGTSSNKMNEVAIVVATKNNTTVQVNGKTNAANTYTLINKGDYVIIQWEKFINTAMHIQSNKNIYVYQTVAGGRGQNTAGMMFIPRLSFNATKEILISGLDMLFGDSSASAAWPSINIVTVAGADVTINGTTVPKSSAFSIVGTQDWVAYRIKKLTDYGDRDGSFNITSTRAMTSSVTFTAGVIGGGGYYSGFGEADAEAGVGTIGIVSDTIVCNETTTLLAEGGLGYTWSARTQAHMQLVTKQNDSILTFTPQSSWGSGLFTYQVISQEGLPSGREILDTTNLFITVETPDMYRDDTLYICKDSTAYLPYPKHNRQQNNSDKTTRNTNIAWTPSQSVSDTHILSPQITGLTAQTTFDVTYDDGKCTDTGHVEVIPVDCGRCSVTVPKDTTLYLGESFNIIPQGFGDFSHWTAATKQSRDTIKTQNSVIAPKKSTTYTANYNNAIRQSPEADWDSNTYCQATFKVAVLALNAAPKNIGDDIYMCSGDQAILNENDPNAANSGALDNYFTWAPDALLDSAHKMSPKATLYDPETEFTVVYDDGQYRVEDTIKVFTEDCGVCRLTAAINGESNKITICKGESVELSADGRGDFLSWEYTIDGNTQRIFEETPTVSPDSTIDYLVKYNNAVKLVPGGEFHPSITCATEAEVTIIDCAVAGEAGVHTLGNHNYTLSCNKPVKLFAVGGDAYTWNSPSGHMHLVAEITPDTLLFTPQNDAGTGPFLFNVEVSGGAHSIPTILSLSITAVTIPDDFGDDIVMCEGEQAILNETRSTVEFSDALDQYFTWAPEALLDNAHTMSPTTTLYDAETEFSVVYDDGLCRVEDTIKVMTEDCGVCRLTAAINGESNKITICKGDSVELSADGRGDFLSWEYKEHGNTQRIFEETPTVSPDSTREYLVKYNNAVKIVPGGEFHPTISCGTEAEITVINCDEVTYPEAKVVKADIFDLDGNGIAETIHVTFDRVLESLPQGISSIDWPVEGGNNITPELEELAFLDSITVVITLEGAFELATEADTTNPPHLTYGNSSAIIEDKIGPVVVSAIKKPSVSYQYVIKNEEGEYSYHLQSDTLIITLSEAVAIPQRNWNSIYSISVADGSPYSLDITTKPSLGENSYTWHVPINVENSSPFPSVGDHVSFNSTSKRTDAFDNTVRERFVEITGSLSKQSGFGTKFRTAVIGVNSDLNQTITTGNIPVYTLQGELLNEVAQGKATLNNSWVPPNLVALPHNSDAQCSDHQVLQYDFDTSCLASLVVAAFKDQGPYTAKVFVLDHLGQYLDHWTQQFGYCKEFENEDRQSLTNIENFFINDLIWDMYDSRDRLVGSGIYFWKVAITYESGKTESFTKQMGLIRRPDACH